MDRMFSLLVVGLALFISTYPAATLADPLADSIQPLATSASAKPSDATPKVGVIIPLTGAMSSWGQSIVNGLNFANLKLPSNEQIKFVFEDENNCNSSFAVVAAKKLIYLDKVSVILTGCYNGTMALVRTARDNNVLLISLGLVTDQIASNGGENIIAPSASISSEVEALVALLKKDGRQRLAIVRVEDNFTEEIAAGLRMSSASNGFVVVSDDKLKFDDFEFRAPLSRLRRSNADAVLIYTSSKQLAKAVTQLRQLGNYETQVYAGYVVEADPPPVSELESLEGVRYTAIRTPTDDDLQVSLQRDNQIPTFQTRVAADLVPELSTAIRTCKSLEPAIDGEVLVRCIRDSLMQHDPNSVGYSGKFSYNSRGYAIRVFTPRLIRLSKYEWLDQNR